MNFTVTLTRSLTKRTADDTIQSQIEKIIRTALKSSLGNNWRYSVSRPVPPIQEDGLWKFARTLTFTKTKGDLNKIPLQWQAICGRLIQAGQVAQFANYPWMVTGGEAVAKLYQELQGEGKVAPLASEGAAVGIKKLAGTVKDFGTINTDPGNLFDHIYDRENQIKIVRSAIEAAKSSDFVNRFNCVLHGPPGCGKSEILLSIGKMLGVENDAFLKFDATSTTEAGAQRILLESSHIPPVLIVEEIEKTDEKSLRWLLGILDQRAEIRKTNFRIGHNAKNVKMLCLATVNDIELFRRVMSGALHSRFAHEIYCPRPDRVVMQKILEREVTKVKGNFAWIEPALKFCVDQLSWNDPRKVVPICLCGGNDLLDGSYQKAVLATIPPAKG